MRDLTRAKRQADDKIEELQEKLALRAKMTFKAPFYYQDGDAVPFCPRCYEKDKLAMHLFLQDEGSLHVRLDCKECGKMYPIEKAGASRRAQVPDRPGPWS